MLLTLALTACLAAIDYAGHQVYRISYNVSKDAAIVTKLQQLVYKLDGAELDVWRQSSSSLDVRVSPAARQEVQRLLQTANLRSRVMMTDVTNNCLSPRHTGAPSLLPATPEIIDTATYFANYRQLADINRYVRQLSKIYPSLVSVFTIGTSWQKRQILAFRMTVENGTSLPSDYDGYSATGKPVIFLEAGIHSREWIAHTSLLFLTTKLLQNFKAGSSEAKELLEKFEFVIVPAVNVDGFVYTWEHNRMWRKTRSDRKETLCPSGEIGGVDPNRNWGYKWRVTSDSSYANQLKTPCNEVFAGPKRFSEPETKAMADFMSSIVKNGGVVAGFIDFHSYAEALLPPWGYKTEMPKDEGYQTELCKEMVDAIEKTHGVRYNYGANYFPSDPGTGPDWAYGKLGVKATMTIELRDTGSHGFCLPKEQIVPVGEEQYAAIVAMCKYIIRKSPEVFENQPQPSKGAVDTGDTRVTVIAVVLSAVIIGVIWCFACGRKGARAKPAKVPSSDGDGGPDKFDSFGDSPWDVGDSDDEVEVELAIMGSPVNGITLGGNSKEETVQEEEVAPEEDWDTISSTDQKETPIDPTQISQSDI